ncbi:MAG: thioredoxin family protein [Owenweeksia sp.]
MKKKITGLAGLALIAAVTFAFKGDNTLNIGEKAPMNNVKMKDVSGKSYALKDLKKDNGLLVVFSCNTCPFVIGWEDTYPGLGELTKEKNIGMVLVNSNEAKRSNDDSFEAMKEHYKEAGYNTPYVLDNNHELADAFGAKTTPHVYLFDKDMKLVYRGSINNKYEDRKDSADKMYLNDAINAMVSGKAIDPAETRQIGCSIKRVKS